MSEIKNYTKCKLVKPETLKPHPSNPNVHPRAQIEALCEVLIENGWRAPVVVSRRSGLVIKGHGRIEAAIRLGALVPVETQDYDDEAAEVRDLIADNKIQELSHLDEKTVASLVAKFKIKSGIGKVSSNIGVLAKSLASVKEKAPKEKKFPILILENEEQYEMFESLKARFGCSSDAACFAKILKRAFGNACADEETSNEDEEACNA